MTNNYLITGEKGVGKSSLLTQLLQQVDLKIAGFAVARIRAKNGKPLVFKLNQASELMEKGAAALIKTAETDFSAAELVARDQQEAKSCQETFALFEGAPKTLNLSAAAGDSLKLLRHQKIFAYREVTSDNFNIQTDVFNNLGFELLDQSGEIVVMDELGRFELKAEKFQKKVFSLLDSEKIVIGVIKNESNPFLDRIRQRDDLKIYELTASNQEQRRKILVDILENLKNNNQDKL
ncbi:MULTISPECIES: nucleoside-triphosphatase [Halanaerobium]|jgi:nucleoside-triphosphatase|uniref:Nucleoside-triphosphatase n=1 Tax=Halanaerobium kushneri TaxID=56779 RepID=A0A1N7AI66_9FIRM|nr:MULTISPECIES: nucleoside-triphosphatase [Halanaerobium]RCW62204.1 nucleoside-triphosphatase [Halanaerobium sp. ST460_2HS_T2]SIR38782.1 nucleoside-triphosphatase [Halanaerobium kushneri]